MLRSWLVLNADMGADRIQRGYLHQVVAPQGGPKA